MRLRNDPLELRRLAAAVEGFCDQHGLAADLARKVNLALDELLTNVMRHGFPPGADGRPDPGHEIEVSVELQSRRLVARLRDDGKPFNPLDLPAPDLDTPLEDRPVGGLGVYLARQMMDSMRYRRVDGRNCLTVTKRLP